MAHWKSLLGTVLCLALLEPRAFCLPDSTEASGDSPRRQLQGARGAGFWSVKGNKFLDANGNEVLFAGVTWSGFETPIAVAHGLESRSYGSHLDQMKKLGFNMLRLAFAGDTLLDTTMPKSNIWLANPDLWGKNSLGVMDAIVAGCRERGIKVILDYHRLHLTDKNERGLWYDANTPESVWINNWVMLAQRYKGDPTVIGADTFNEVHPGPDSPAGTPIWNVSGGIHEQFNFRSAILRLIKAVHPVNPGWIFFIEGMWQGYWWGGNVALLHTAPITYPPGKVAYSAHEYGPYVYPSGQFFQARFPGNLLPLFESKWGIVHEKGLMPVWVGEFGSFYPPPTTKINRIERVAFKTLITYIKRLNAPWTLAFWNPDSKDTGGILREDYKTINWQKMGLLLPIMHPDFGPSPA